MAFNIFFLSYTWQSVGFWFHVIHYGCFFFCPCVLGFSLNDCTPGELNFNPLCVSVDTGRLLWPACTERRLLYLFKLARPGCCHAAAIRRKTHHTAKHAHNRHTAERSCDNCYISCLKPLLPSPFFFMMYVFLESFSSTSEGFRNVGWDSFTKCTLYVFSKPLGRPGCSHISSHLTDGLLFVFLFLPHHWSCMFVEVSYHYAVLQKL